MIYFINLLVVFLIALIYKISMQKRILSHYIYKSEPIIKIIWSNGTYSEYGKTGNNFYLLPNWEKCNNKLNEELLKLYENY